MHRAQPMQRPWGRNIRDVLRLELRENGGRRAGGDVRERMRDQLMSGLVGYCKNLASDFKDPIVAMTCLCLQGVPSLEEED